MKNVVIVLCAAVLLGGCGAAEKKESIAVTPTLAAETTPTLTPEPVIAGPIEATIIAPMHGGYIDAVGLLQKLDEIGCTLDRITIREVKRGGAFSASCIVTDPLNVPVEDL